MLVLLAQRGVHGDSDALSMVESCHLAFSRMPELLGTPQVPVTFCGLCARTVLLLCLTPWPCYSRCQSHSSLLYQRACDSSLTPTIPRVL